MSRYIGRSYQSLQDERNRRMQEAEEDGGEVEEFIDYGGPHRHCYFCYSSILCSMRYQVLKSFKSFICIHNLYLLFISSYSLAFLIAFTEQIVIKAAILQPVQRAVVLYFMAAKMKNI